MSEKAEAALQKLRALWQKEREATHQQFVAERARLSLAERVTRGLALRDMSIDETEAVPGGRTRLWLSPRKAAEMENTRIGPGDPLRLWWTAPDAPEAVRAIAGRRGNARLAVVIEGDVPERLTEGEFNVDRDEPQVTFERGEKALRRFLDAESRSDVGRLREVLFGARAAEWDKRPSVQHLDAALNDAQRDAVLHGLTAKDVALIHGPPGTGKTRTLVEVIRLAAARGEKVLATAASNTAVDNLAERLVVAGVNVVRLGHPARVSAAMESRSLDALLEATPDYTLARKWMAEANVLFKRMRAPSRAPIDRPERRAMAAEARALMRDARAHLKGIQEAILARADVVCATATGADATLLDELDFELVVLDEATQCPDPCALIALARGKRAVLAGDPRQLPPTVVDRDAAAQGLSRTMFEALDAQDRAAFVRMLVVQHRMHETLMRFPSDSMYGGALAAADEVRAHTLADLGIAPDGLRPDPLAFVDTAGKGWDERRAGEDPSTSNPQQAERTAAEVRRLLSRGVALTDIGVITPYDAQVRLLRARLETEWRAGLEIGSVDGFQGREKEAIVVDLVRSNGEGAIGFLADTRRMNVALTRARRFLLVVGDSATLSGNAYYGAFMDAAERAGAHVSAWADDAPTIEP